MPTIQSFSLGDFKSAISKLARPNLFVAEITGLAVKMSNPSNPSGGGLKLPTNFKFKCERAEFPGKTLTTIDDSGVGGPAFKLPYDFTYNDMQLSIICTEDMAERKFFETWMNRIIGIPNNSENSGLKAGLVEFHDNYAKGINIKVRQLDDKGNTLLSWTCKDVYPIAISAMDASWESISSYQRFGIVMHYRSYIINDGDPVSWS